MQDAKVGLVPQVPWPLELGVATLLLGHLLYEGLVRGLREPALLVQQGQHTWRVVLQRARRAGSEQGRPGLRLPRESRPPTHTHISSPLALLPQLPTYKDEGVPSFLPPKSVCNLSCGQWTSIGDEAAGALAEHACCCPLVAGGTSNITKMSLFSQRNSLLCAQIPSGLLLVKCFPEGDGLNRGARSTA